MSGCPTPGYFLGMLWASTTPTACLGLATPGSSTDEAVCAREWPRWADFGSDMAFYGLPGFLV